jgi:GNAT superfamily N-acetyltransferase
MLEKSFKIEPLNNHTLLEVTTLRDTYFKNLSSYEQELLKASLSPKVFKDVLHHEEINSIQYWALIDTTIQTVIGMIGVYFHRNSPSTAWLGWFVVDKKYRKQKLGDKLLCFAINEAKKQNAKELHLYSWDSKTYQPALKLYEKYDFFYYTSNQKGYKRDVFMKKFL